jgi:hypothetical protein
MTLIVEALTRIGVDGRATDARVGRDQARPPARTNHRPENGRAALATGRARVDAAAGAAGT